MGASHSKHIIDTIDLSKLEYLALSEASKINSSGWRYVKWSTVPQEIKTYMKDHVAKHYKEQLDIYNFVSIISIPKYWEYSEKHKLAISYDDAILEYLKDINMDIPFTLSMSDRCWNIHRIYNVNKV